MSILPSWYVGVGMQIFINRFAIPLVGILKAKYDGYFQIPGFERSGDGLDLVGFLLFSINFHFF